MKCIDPDCPHFECQTCAADVCPDRHASPGEAEFVCAPCWEFGERLRQAITEELL